MNKFILIFASLFIVAHATHVSATVPSPNFAITPQNVVCAMGIGAAFSSIMTSFVCHVTDCGTSPEKFKKDFFTALKFNTPVGAALGLAFLVGNNIREKRAASLV